MPGIRVRQDGIYCLFIDMEGHPYEIKTQNEQTYVYVNPVCYNNYF
jgi:hypothetical protein